MKLKKSVISASQLLMCSMSLSAAEFEVLTNGDTGGGLANEVGPGQYQVDTLRSAIELAMNESSFPGVDVITFADSLFGGGPVTIDLNTVGATLNVYGDLSNSAFGINSEVTISGPSAELLELNAGDMRHFQVTGSGQLNLSHVTLSGGQVPDQLTGRGGAIYAGSQAALHLSHAVLRDNVANTGGAINIRSNEQVSTINHTLITNNTTTGTFGSGTGGGIFKQGNAALEISNTVISSNHANYAGGGLFTSGNLMIENSSIVNNFANRYGGGVGTNNIGNLTMINSTVSNNVARFGGGGIQVGSQYDEEVNLIIGSTIANNHAYYYSNANEFPTLTGIEGSGHVFNIKGGGLLFDTFGSMEIHNTLIAGNVAFTEQQPDDIAAIPEAVSGFNFFGVADPQIGLQHGVNGNQIGDLAQPLDAQLLPLADNGGPTLTHRINRTSPAVDAGDDAVVASLSQQFDQRGEGFPRQVSTVDIGAFELDMLFANGFD